MKRKKLRDCDLLPPFILFGSANCPSPHIACLLHSQGQQIYAPLVKHIRRGQGMWKEIPFRGFQCGQHFEFIVLYTG